MSRMQYGPRPDNRAGGYNRRMRFWRSDKDRSANTDGQRPESEEFYLERWGKLLPISALEQFTALQNKMDITHKVRVRKDSRTTTLNSSFWITLADDTRLDIVGGPIDVQDQRMELEFTCRQRV